MLYQNTKFTFFNVNENCRGSFTLRLITWERLDEVSWNFGGILVKGAWFFRLWTIALLVSNGLVEMIQCVLLGNFIGL